MKRGQYFALLTGVFFLLVGFLGFIPAFVQEPAVSGKSIDLFDAQYGYLMGAFPINVFHNVVHITVGLLGVLASISLGASRVYGRGLAAFYGLLTLMGLLPYTNTTFGLIPIFGNDVLLHLSTAAIAFYFGFIDAPGLLELSDRTRDNAEKFYGDHPSAS